MSLVWECGKGAQFAALCNEVCCDCSMHQSMRGGVKVREEAALQKAERCTLSISPVGSSRAAVMGWKALAKVGAAWQKGWGQANAGSMEAAQIPQQFAAQVCLHRSKTDSILPKLSPAEMYCAG